MSNMQDKQDMQDKDKDNAGKKNTGKHVCVAIDAAAGVNALWCAELDAEPLNEGDSYRYDPESGVLYYRQDSLPYEAAKALLDTFIGIHAGARRVSYGDPDYGHPDELRQQEERQETQETQERRKRGGKPRKLSSAHLKVLNHLADGRWHGRESIVLAAGQREALRRLRELRDLGYHIAVRVSNGHYDYRLVGRSV